jgi:hypothetical protein
LLLKKRAGTEMDMERKSAPLDAFVEDAMTRLEQKVEQCTYKKPDRQRLEERFREILQHRKENPLY